MGVVRASTKPDSFGLGNGDLETAELDKVIEKEYRASETFIGWSQKN